LTQVGPPRATPDSRLDSSPEGPQPMCVDQSQNRAVSLGVQMAAGALR